MAEGDSTQNQGQQQQSDQSKEVKPEVVDQQKLDRAEKERERRRRRRRKKAELRRLQREMPSEQQNVKAGQQPVSVPVEEHAKPRSPHAKPQPENEKIVQQNVPLAKKPNTRVRKPRLQTREAKKVEPLLPLVPRKPLRAGPDETAHHLTHSFAGPLIEAKARQEPAPQTEEPVRPQQQEPVSEPQSEPKPEPAAESQPVSKPEPIAEIQAEPVAESQPVAQMQPEPEPLSQHAMQPEPEPEPEPLSQHAMQPEPEPEPLPEHVIQPEPAQTHEQPLSKQSEDVVIHGQNEEVSRPQIDTTQVHREETPPPEVPSIFSFEQPAQHHEAQHTEPQPVQDLHARQAERKEEEPHEEVVPVHKGLRPLEENKPIRENKESSKEAPLEGETLHDRKSFAQSAGAFSAGLFKNLGMAFHNFRLKFDFGKLWLFLIFVIIGGFLYGAYIFQLPQKTYNYVADFFKAPPPVEVNIDNELLNEWGITTALIFGDNRGSTKDWLASQVYNAYYFGYLGEAKLNGETGITPAYYYGNGLDMVAQTDEFIGYITTLRQLVSSYDVDVYAMLDQSKQRTQTLDAYMASLKDIMAKSTANVKKINTQIDDLKVSYDSLTTGKTQYQTDFFAALQALAGEKSDFLLKSYVDTSQKQVAIKARQDALQALLTYYTSSMNNVAIRITSIEQNHQALAQGIHVVNIPGANLNIILQSAQPTK